MANHFKTETKYVKVQIKLTDNEMVVGDLNIIGYDRFTDFLEKEKSNFIKLSDVNHGGSQAEVMVINPNEIKWIKPAPEQLKRESNV